MNTIKKLEAVLNEIRNIFLPKHSFTALDLADELRISRSMASNYLNQLVKLEMLEKENTRPVQFWYVEEKDAFSDLIGKDSSMEKIVEQCKSSVNYPPSGLPIIIKGSSGVGKSMIAQMIYQYARSNQVIEADAPFITLNCADYANNPELLSSILFGYIKGAFTGADQEKNGLLDAADKGYLFLDEVHNLSQENQEKLFLLIDQHKFRRLGEESKWCKANIRLILATTENVENKLLATFRRRIPLEITLPDYSQRSRQERIQLVYHFFQIESSQIKKDVFVDPKIFQELVELDVEGNIGAVQNCIKIYCASAYNKQRQDTYIVVSNDNRLSKEQKIHISYLPEKMAIASVSSAEYMELQRELHEEHSINGIQSLLPSIIERAEKIRKNTVPLISEYELIYALLQKNIQTPNFYGVTFSEKHLKDVALLIDLAEEIKRERLHYGPNQDLPRYTKLVDYILDATHKKNVSLFVRDLITAYLMNYLPLKSHRNVLIVMHGKRLAYNLAYEINNLVGEYVIDALDMPIQVETKEIVKHVNEYISKRDTRDGLLLLVDMGSLEKMYEQIKDNVAGDLLIVNNISTALALHIGFGLVQNQPMEYYTTMDYNQFNVRPQFFEGLSQIDNIVISCMSGAGIAQKIKDILDAQVGLKPFELIILDYEKLAKLEKEHNVNSFKNTRAIISTSPIKISGVNCLNLEQIVNGTDNLESLLELYNPEQLNIITNEIIKFFTIEGASSRLRFLNPDMVINEIELIIQKFEERYDVEFKNFIRVNLFLHLSSMIERILIGDFVDDDIEQTNSEELQRFIPIAEELFEPIKQKYNILIPIREYEYIYKILAFQS